VNRILFYARPGEPGRAFFCYAVVKQDLLFGFVGILVTIPKFPVMSSTTTSKNRNRYRRLHLITIGMVVITIAGILLYSFLNQHKGIPDVAADLHFAVMPEEDTSIGRCAQYPIGAIELQKLYLANDPVVAEKYTNETVYLNGIYIGTGINPMGTAYMILKSSDRSHSIKCFLQNKEDINLTKGSPVFLKGYCRGLIWDLKIEECELLDFPVVASQKK